MGIDSGIVGSHVVLQVIEFRVLLLINHLFVRQSRLGLRVPVHHAHATVDEAFVIEVAEHLDDTLAPDLVHGKGRAVPVARSAQTAQLLQDDAAVLMGPVPGMLQKFLTRQVALLDALLGQAVHHLGFCGYRGMVGARHPACILAFHTGAAHQYVLYRLVQHVAHVQDARHVGRRYHHRKRLASVWL